MQRWPARQGEVERLRRGSSPFTAHAPSTLIGRPLSMILGAISEQQKEHGAAALLELSDERQHMPSSMSPFTWWE